MAKIRKLKAALLDHKGFDPEKERQKRLQKKAAKASRQKAPEKEEPEVADAEGWEDESDEGGVKVGRLILTRPSLMCAARHFPH
jgi:hypothetical protein